MSSMKYPYRDLGVTFDRQFRNDLNANFDDIEHDIRQIGGEAAQQALEAADEANTQAIYAQTSGDYAQDKGDYAAQQGDYAKTQGDYAKTQGDAANLAATNANDAANNANSAAANANNAATAANDAATNANTAADNANNAATNANTAADNANTQATNAQNAAQSANDAATNANNAADNANTQAAYAQIQGDYAKAQGDYAKQIGDENKTRWLTAVNTYADIATTYTNPQLGDTVQTIDDSKIYRWDGTQWVWTQQYNANAITDVQNKIGILSKNVVNVAAFVVGDGIEDDTTALQNAVNEAKNNNKGLYCPPGLTIKITQTVDMFRIKQIDFRSEIVSYVDHGIGVIAGLNSSSTESSKYYFHSVIKNGTLYSDDVTLRLQGLKNAHVTVVKADALQLYAYGDDTTMSSMAYSQYHLGKIKRLHIYSDPSSSSGGWINENSFYGGRIAEFIMDGNYHHNENVFYKPCFEQGSVKILKGARNRFYDFRSEGGTTVEFGTGTYHNVMFDNHINTSADLKGSATVTKNDGIENFVISTIENLMDRRTIYLLDKNVKIFNTGEIGEQKFIYNNIIPGIDKLSATSGAFIEFIVPCDEVKRFEFKSDSPHFAVWINAYDENMNILDPNGPDGWQIYNYGGSYYVAGNDYRTNITGNYFRITVVGTKARYIKIKIRVNVGGQSKVDFRYCRVDALVPKGANIQFIESLRNELRRPLYSPTKPTKGLALKGETIANGTGYFQCVERLDKTVSNTTTGGETVVPISSNTNIQVDDIVAILLDDGSTHWSSVSNISGVNITIADPLPSQVSSGKPFIVMRWA